MPFQSQDSFMPGAGAAQGDVLDFYARPATMTSAGKHARLFEDLPSEVGELAGVIQGLGLYDVVASDFYGFAVPEERKGEIHIRTVEAMLDRILAMDDRPLALARPVDRRLLSRCRGFALLLIAMLRAKGVPARARCGFGAYFNRPFFEDHWVCEYWNADEGRWALADPQFDAVWREKLHVRHDVLDVPRDQFLVAGDAWERCRTGAADPSKFGIGFAGLRGLWFVAGDLVRETAALNKVEMLPWDIWGVQPRPDRPLNEGKLAFFDHLAGLTRDPDACLAELRSRYDSDDRLRVPTSVFNALLDRREAA
jgi:Transglutaminase-like superfamily